MQFEWDEAKNQANIRNHGIDFSGAQEIFRWPMMVALDDRRDYGEERWIGIGLLQGRVMVVVFAEPTEDSIRIVSVRKALSYERAQYEQFIKDRLEQG
jgi:uncharacterized protein